MSASAPPSADVAATKRAHHQVSHLNKCHAMHDMARLYDIEIDFYTSINI